MKQASTFLTKSELDQIESAIAAAEKKTSVEIVTAISTASGRYDRGEDMAGLWFGAIALMLAWIFWPIPATSGDTWGYSTELHHIGWLAILVIAFIIGALIASRISFLRALFTPKAEMRDEVEGKARQVFFDQRIHRTEGGTGILIYISLFERMVTILADEPVQETMPGGSVQSLCDQLTQSLGRNTAEGLSACIDTLGDTLSEAFPHADDDVDELANAVVLIDQ